MPSRRKTYSRRGKRTALRVVGWLLQLVLVGVGALAVAIYVSRMLPPLPTDSKLPSTHQSPTRKPDSALRPPPDRPSRQPLSRAEQAEAAAVQAPEPLPPLSLPMPTTSLKITDREVDRGSSSRKMVALTFDAGSSAEPTLRILEALAKHGVRCTFFLTGKWIERYPQIARQIVAEGHELGNHSWSHPPFTTLSDEQIREQLRQTEEIALRVCGSSTKPLFRPPYGDRDQRVRAVVAQEGYLTIYWTIDSLDSVKKGITPSEIFSRVTRLMRPGAIVLMHCGSDATADALPDLLEWLRREGYEAVTVSKLLAASGYTAEE